MTAWILEQPITVRGETIALLPDEIKVASQFQDSLNLAPSTSEYEFIWFREGALQSIREAHPSIPVYGVWQTLLASKLIDLKHPLHILEINANTGLYLVCDKGRAIDSGRWIGKKLPPDVPTQFADGKRVAVESFDQLSLPKRKALLPSDLSKQSAIKARVAYGFSGIAALLIAGGGFSVDLYLKHRSERYQADAKRIEAQATDIDAQASTFLQNANTVTAEEISKYRSALSRLMDLYQHSDGLHLDNLRFGVEEWVGKVEKPPLGLSFDVSVDAKPAEDTTIHFAPLGAHYDSPPGK